MSPRLRWRKFVSGFMLTMTGVCALVAVSVLFFILGYLVYHGGTSINWSFFTKLPKPVGEAGGGLAERCSVNRYRNLRVQPGSAAVQAFFDSGGRFCAGTDDDSDYAAKHR